MIKSKNRTPPAIILVRPQLGENIGMCARAMLNCGVYDLRIVSPRDSWPNPAAIAAATGASKLIENAKIFNNVKDAIADLHFVFATTARNRDIAKEIYNTKEASLDIREKTAHNLKCGIMFGPERTGLESDDLYYANAILNIPLNHEFCSLNLAQAVLITCFEWLNCNNHFVTPTKEMDIANKQEIDNLINHLDTQLQSTNFFKNKSRMPNTLKNLKGFFFRTQPTNQEVKTLIGIIKALSKARDDDK